MNGVFLWNFNFD